MLLLIIGLTLLLVYIVLNCLYKNTNHYKNSRLMYRAIEDGIPDHISFVNLGSTYSQYAFNCYDTLGLDKAFNFALPCESIEADLVKLKFISNNLEEGCIVAITLAPCNTLYYWGQLHEGIKHYGYMKKKTNKDWHFMDYLRYLMPMFPFSLKKVFRIFHDVKLQNDITDVFPSHVYSDSEIKDLSKQMAQTWMGLFGLADLKRPINKHENFEMVERNKSVVSEMIDFCMANSFRPIIVTTPFIGTLNSYFSDSFIQSTLGPVFQVAKEKNVPIYDFRSSEEFQNNSGLYSDGFFCLNKYGSEKFVKSLFSKMKSDGIVMNNKLLKACYL